MKFHVYVLCSLKNNRRYVGYSAKDPKDRLKEHNWGAVKSTKNNQPYNLIYTEDFDSKKDVLAREKFLKSGQGRKFLNKYIPP